jgi:hypothetical protein
MSLDLKPHIVAFIDLLGFSGMVAHDCEKPAGEQKYIEALYGIHQKTKEITIKLEGMSLIQFSDSVVLSIPYSKDHFHKLCRIISDFQFDLLKSGILCRGGISYGKHFSTEDFLFSHGLIDAYTIESKIASTPRIVIGHDLAELVFDSLESVKSDVIIKENDGLLFIDYLNGDTLQDNRDIVDKCLPRSLSKNPSIRSKQLWLIDYFNHKHPENKIRHTDRFAQPHF